MDRHQTNRQAVLSHRAFERFGTARHGSWLRPAGTALMRHRIGTITRRCAHREALKPVQSTETARILRTESAAQLPAMQAISAASSAVSHPRGR
jgi:hypothetical protein